VKRLVFRVIDDESTRLAALKRGEVDLAYSIRGELAEEVLRTPGLKLNPAVIQAPQWIYFPEQWDPKSPWADQRVRQAVAIGFDRKAINQAVTLGHSRLTNSIIPDSFDFFWRPPAPVYDPKRAKQLLAEAGFPNGFDGGDYNCDAAYANVAEAVINFLGAIGIRMKLRPLERASFIKNYAEKKFRGFAVGGSGAFGNAATRIEAYVAKGGTYVYGSHADMDALFEQQAAELDQRKRTAILHQIQQLMHERTIFAPIWQLAFLNASGPRVKQTGLGLIEGHPYSAPYEEVALVGK
jgi:peptide/nickel transport system substrate-binding protein